MAHTAESNETRVCGFLGTMPGYQGHREGDYYVMALGAQTWGIRGHIAYDGDVLAATFPSEHDAWIVLSPLRPHHVSA
jgi:hypothetical protein